MKRKPMTPDTKNKIKALSRIIPDSIETWQPEPGERLIGEVICLLNIARRKNAIMILVRNEHGRFIETCLTGWLAKQLRVYGAMPGNIISLIYQGERQGPSGVIYDAFHLIVYTLNHQEGNRYYGRFKF